METIDWQIVAVISAPILALFVGVGFDRWYESRQRLLAYFTNAGGFIIRLDGPPPEDMQCVTFSLVLRNAGRRATENVRIGHFWLPKNVAINPSIPNQIDNSPPGTAAEVVIDRIVPNQIITISYLVFQDVQASNIISYVTSNDGTARVRNLVPTPQLPNWVLRLLLALMIIGAVTILYLLYEFASGLVGAAPLTASGKA